MLPISRWLPVALGLIALLATLPARAAGPDNAAVVDARRDLRLARRLVLRAGAVPVAHVLRRLSAQTGVPLSASGPAASERLIAFTHDASLGEIMLAIADLYRLQWTRGGTPERPAYTLSQRPAEALADRDLRRAAFRRVLERVQAAGAAAQNAPVPADVPPAFRQEHLHSLALRAAAFRLAATRWEELAQEGFVQVPVSALPAAERDRIMPHLVPFVESHYRLAEEDRLRRLEQLRQQNLPIEKRHTEPMPPTAPEAHVFRINLSIPNGGELQLSLWGDHSGTILSEGKTEALPEVGHELYADRPLRPGAPAAGPFAAALSLPPLPGSPAPVSRSSAESEGIPYDWISRLSLLSDAAGIAIYSDYYGGGPAGRDGVPLKLAGKGTVAEALDALCGPKSFGRIDDWFAYGGGVTASFWWARPSAALIRSRRWLWEVETVIPVATVDRLTAAVREKRPLTALEFPLLAALPRFQRDSGGTTAAANDAWKYGVLLPARLSSASRGLALGTGLTSDNLPPVDRTAFGALLPVRPDGRVPAYSSRVSTRLDHDLTTGRPEISVGVEVALDGRSHASRYPIPLPHEDGRDLLVAAAAAPAPPTKLERLVMALYFPWYGLAAVSGKQRNQEKIDLNGRKVGNFADFPAAGPYDSADEAVLRRHVAQLKEAGVDVLVCSWWGPDDPADAALRKLMPLAKAAGLRVCLLLEAWKPLATPEQTAADLAAWLKPFKDQDVYLKVDGKPVLFVQNVMKGRQSLQAWADTLARLEQTGRVFAVTLRASRAEASVFSGLHTPAMVPRASRTHPDPVAFMRSWMTKQVENTAGWGRGRPRAVVAAVTPGFDMRHSIGPDAFVPRDQGRVYRASWEAALIGPTDWVLINSFNQWQIGTEIEPSDQHGDLYVRLTAEYAARFKNPTQKLTN